MTELNLAGSKYIRTGQDPESGDWFGITHDGVIEKILPPRTEWLPRPTERERVGKGMMDMYDGAKQAYLYAKDPEEYGRFTAEKDKERAAYEQALKEMGVEGIDWPALGGEAVAASAVGPLHFGKTMAGKIASGALQGGLATGMMYTPESDRGFAMDRGINTALGMGGGIIAPPLMEGAKRIAAGTAMGAQGLFNKLRSRVTPNSKLERTLKEAIPEFESLGDRMQAMIIKEARDQLENTGKVEGEALERMALAEELGMTGDKALTTGQITRDPRLFGREKNIANMEGGEPLKGRFTAQHIRFSDELRQELPKSVVARSDAGSAVIDGINYRWDESQKAVSKVYTMIRNRHGDATVDDGLPALGEFLQDEIADPNNTIAAAAYNKGKQLGLFGDDVSPVSLTNIENFRKWIGRRSDKNEPELKRFKRLAIDALDNEVIDTFGDDLFKAARDKAHKRFSDFSRNLVQKITQGNLDDDKLLQRALSGSYKDLEQMKYLLTTPIEKRGLDEAGRFTRGDAFQQGQEAWDAMRSAVLDNIWKKSSDPDSGEFFAKRFRDQLEGIGEKKLKVLFEPDEFKLLKNIRDLSGQMFRDPPYAGVNYSKSAPAMYDLLSRVPSMQIMGQEMRDAARQQLVDFDVTRGLQGQSAPRLSFDEVLQNMEALGLTAPGQALRAPLAPATYGGLLSVGATE